MGGTSTSVSMSSRMMADGSRVQTKTTTRQQGGQVEKVVEETIVAPDGTTSTSRTATGGAPASQRLEPGMGDEHDEDPELRAAIEASLRESNASPSPASVQVAPDWSA